MVVLRRFDKKAKKMSNAGNAMLMKEFICHSMSSFVNSQCSIHHRIFTQFLLAIDWHLILSIYLEQTIQNQGININSTKNLIMIEFTQTPPNMNYLKAANAIRIDW